MAKKAPRPKRRAKKALSYDLKDAMAAFDDVAPDGRYYSSMSEGQYADEMARELGGE